MINKSYGVHYLKCISYFLFLGLIFSCSSYQKTEKKIVFTKKAKQVFAFSVQDANVRKYDFNDETKYKVSHLSWYDFLTLECGEYHLVKDCLVGYDKNWELYFKRFLKEKSKSFWYVKIMNDKEDLRRQMVYFIDEDLNILIQTYYDAIPTPQPKEKTVADGDIEFIFLPVE